MKKIFLMGLVVTIGLTSTVKAQRRKEIIEVASFMPTQGTQTVPVPGGKGTLQFTNNDDKISTVVFMDATGKRFNLLPSKPGTNGAPQPSCKYPLPDACFATTDKSIGMCICKPTDLSGNNGPYTIEIKGLLSSISTTTVSGAH